MQPCASEPSGSAQSRDWQRGQCQAQEDSRDLQCQCSTREQNGIRYAPPWLEGTGQRCPNAVSAASSDIQLKAEQRLHSPAHRRRRDSERQETWWLEHWQRESAQGLIARLRRWPGDLQRRVLPMPLQHARPRSQRNRSPSVCEHASGSGMRMRGSHHRHELQARPLEHAGCFETHWPASAKQAPESVAPTDGKQGDT